MRKIYIVTDSTADIPKELEEGKDIIKVPLDIAYKGATYRDGVDMTVDELLALLPECEELPKTSQVNPQRFYDIYSELLKEDAYIISVHLSSKLSGTYQSAVIAKEMLESDRIFVVDSRSISMGTGLLAVEAYKMYKQGCEINVIVDRVNYLSTKVRAIFAVDTLEYLRQGGRIGNVQAAIGMMLNIKPLIHMVDGRLEVFDKVRGLKKAQKGLLQHIIEDDIDTEMYFAPGHGGNLESMTEFKNSVEEATGAKTFTTFTVGSVVAVYSGPGVFGCNYFVK